jgi:ABC-type polysaccharide/polyol phosphate transport system ATPase subunit
MFLGESPEEIERKIGEIAEFSELGEFIHMTARTYSTGMFMRLAFATSTAINPEILIADEVVGAGDAQFAEKAKRRIEELLSGERTTVLSSHSMDLIRNFCHRVIWLHHGQIIADGDCEEIITDYESRAPMMGR